SFVLISQVGGHDVWAGSDHFRLAVGDLLAVVHDHDTVGQLHDGLHVVLDHEHAHAFFANALHELQHLRRFHCVQAGHHLIQQKQLRLRGQGLGDLETLASGQRQRACNLLGARAEAHTFDHLACTLSRLVGGTTMQKGADHDVLDDGHFAKGAHDLVGTHEATLADFGRAHAVDAFALEPDFAAGRVQETRCHGKEGGLARTVWPDEAEDFLLIDLEADLVDGLEATEMHGDVLVFKQAHCLASASLGVVLDFPPNSRDRITSRPCGSTRITTMSRIPYSSMSAPTRPPVT